MGNHDKALRTLVVGLSDLPAAEGYCDEMAEGKRGDGEQDHHQDQVVVRSKQALLLNLLKIYLRPGDGENR